MCNQSFVLKGFYAFLTKDATVTATTTREVNLFQTDTQTNKHIKSSYHIIWICYGARPPSVARRRRQTGQKKSGNTTIFLHINRETQYRKTSNRRRVSNRSRVPPDDAILKT